MPIVLPGVPRCPQGTQIPVAPPCPPCPCVPPSIQQVAVSSDPPAPAPQNITIQWDVPVTIVVNSISPATGVPTTGAQVLVVDWDAGEAPDTGFQVSATATTAEGCSRTSFFIFGGRG